MIDPVTTEQLAKFAVKEMLERAEHDRLVAEIRKSNDNFFAGAVAFVRQWTRRFRSESPRQKPVRYSPVTRRS